MDPKEVGHLRAKLQDRFGRARLGILVAVGGFTSNVEPVLQRLANTDAVVLALDGRQLGEWVDAADRAEWLKKHLGDAVMRVTE